MLSLKCKNCGGEMVVDGSGSLACGYCGSKYSFHDRELEGYRNFRLQMLQYLRGVHDQKLNGESHEDLLWANAETICYCTRDEKEITLRYLYSHDDGVAQSYLTRSSAVFVFQESSKADQMLEGIRKLSYPPADVKGLQECFPRLNGRYDLKDGGVLLAFDRPENLFPLSMFGSLSPEHVAWIISRMENICCVLCYSDLIHAGISEESIWINPFNHHAVLMGKWYLAREMSGAGFGVKRDQDLVDLRKTADRVLGMNKENAPKELSEFINKWPAEDAYADFADWDQVIEKGFGGRRFAQMKTTF